MAIRQTKEDACRQLDFTSLEFREIQVGDLNLGVISICVAIE